MNFKEYLLEMAFEKKYDLKFTKGKADLVTRVDVSGDIDNLQNKEIKQIAKEVSKKEHITIIYIDADETVKSKLVKHLKSFGLNAKVIQLGVEIDNPKERSNRNRAFSNKD